MTKKCLVLILALMLSTSLFPASAKAEFETLKPSPWTQLEDVSYMERSINKLGFGLLNLLTGWSSLLFDPVRYDNAFTGLAKGAWRTVTNTAGGALHTATFLVPVDIPLPEGGVRFAE